MARNTYIKTASGWEQVASTVLAVPQGLVPIVPSSVSGTGVSFTGDGKITVAASTSFTINGVFSAAYKNYRIIVSTTGSSATANKSTLRFATGGVANTTTNYTWTHNYTQGSSTLTASSGTTTTVTSATVPFFNDMVLEVFSPFSSTRATVASVNTVYSATNFYGQAGFNATTSFDGFQLTGNTFDVTIQIYGYSQGGLTQPQQIQPFAVSTGTSSAAMVSGSPWSSSALTTVTLPVGRFTQAPIVAVNAATASTLPQTAYVQSSSAASFTYRHFIYSSTTTTLSIHWTATQMTSASGSG